MIDPVNVSGNPGSLQIGFNTSLVATPDLINSVYVMYGSDSSSETQQAQGQALSVNADGSIACIVALSTDLNPVHFTCYVTDYNNHTDQSADQSYPANNGGTQSNPTASITSSSAVISWTSSDPGTGLVLYTGPDGKQWQAPDDAAGSSTSHSATLSDLASGAAYTYQVQTDFDDDSLATVLSGNFSFNTLAGAPPVDNPGRVQVGASPTSVKVGASSVVSVQVLKHDGTPQAGIAVAFSLGAGQAGGALSADSGMTDATGLCSTTFKDCSLPGKRKHAHRFVVALSGAAGGKQKRRRAMVMVTK